MVDMPESRSTMHSAQLSQHLAQAWMRDAETTTIALSQVSKNSHVSGLNPDP
jgi:hypothetical protein